MNDALLVLMYKISGFTMGERLLERLVNDESIENEREAVKSIDWGYVDSDSLSSVPVTGKGAERVRAALQAVDADHSDWNECDLTPAYRFCYTEAPESYDGFGTMTVAQIGERARVVAIRVQHVQWQHDRYGSGLYPCQPLGRPLPIVSNARGA